MNYRMSFFAMGCIALAAAGCNTTSLMDVPTVAVAQPISVDKPVEAQATFALSKVIAGIRRGTPILHYPSTGFNEMGVEGTLCNYKTASQGIGEWGTGSMELGNWRDELGEIFYETMSDRQLNVAGDPRDLFEKENAVASAEYRVGAVITEIRGNVCHSHHWGSGRPLYEYSGELFVDVEWSVFSNLLKRLVLKTNTQGYYKLATSKRNGRIVMLHEAFARATENLTAKQAFVDIAARRDAVGAGKRRAGPEIVFRSPEMRTKALEADIGAIFPAVVTIRAGTGHGSGFSISRDGLLLTNAHVVGDAKRVAVVLNNGVEVTGVVERFDRQRDVALVKVPLRMPNALPLRAQPAKPLETVYAIGSPLDESLKSTVTRGIVSALRKIENSGLPIIQADVAISPGNSGGPLLDRHGNVIGISTLRFVGRGAQNLNGFVPIGEALKSLNLRSAGQASPAGS